MWLHLIVKPLDSTLAQLIEIALVKHNPDGSIEEWSSLIKPTKRISPSNQAIHGISPSMVQQAPILKTSIQNFKRLFQTVFGRTQFKVRRRILESRGTEKQPFRHFGCNCRGYISHVQRFCL